MSGSDYKILLIIIILLISNFLFACSNKFSNNKLIKSDSLALECDLLSDTNILKDQWFAADKGYHLIGSIISTAGISNSCMQFADIKKEKSIRIGAGFTFMLGLGKEFWDRNQKDNIFSWKDLSADVLGILIGITLLQID
jgi:uncharacterized protein YfiM (DUF2279 family)